MNREIQILIAMLLAVLGLVAGGFLINFAFGMEVGTEQVKCFDRFSNEIIGGVCINKTESYEPPVMGMLGMIIIFSFVWLGFIVASREV